MRRLYPIFAAALLLACGKTEQTSGFFVGTVGSSSGRTQPPSLAQTQDTPARAPEDTLLNCTFSSVLDRPFGPDVPYDVYGGALQIDNRFFDDPVILLSTAGLVRDGTVTAAFNIIDAPAHAVAGIALRADGPNNFLLLGVNGRGQYTIQRCINGLWIPVMGLDAFETSRLLPYRLGQVEITALVHGSYTDLIVNGQLIQVVRTTVPPLGQIGVFVDGRMRVELDRITVVPL
jgi:hypothetical protein